MAEGLRRPDSGAFGGRGGRLQGAGRIESVGRYDYRRIKYDYLPPTEAQRGLGIAQADEARDRLARKPLCEGRECPGCGARFLANIRLGQRYCSPRCRGRGAAQTRDAQGRFHGK
jgi:hypothetical protein